MHNVLRFAFRGTMATALSAILGIHMTLTGALPVQAATAPNWQWSDASSALSVRADRPVWSLAYANAGWIGTDGQNLYNGGRVWKTDGTKTIDLTADAKANGLWRVDAIVSDGSSAMLLANVGRTDLVVASYDNGFRNRTEELKTQFAWDETVAAISGKNGSWLIVTTKGNVLEWTPALLSFVKRSVFTDGVANHLPQAALRFRIPQNGNDVAPTAVLPLSYGWLIVLPTNENNPQSQYYFYANGVAKQVSNLFPGLGTVSAFASNGDRAVLIGADRGTNWNVVGYTYDGIGVTAISNMSASNLSRTGWIDARMAWTGTTWTVFAGKNGFRIQDSVLTAYGQSRDYFLTMASNNKGTVLVGGAMSKAGNAAPTAPLTAKLVRLNETAGIAYTNTPNLKTTAWSWVEPTVTELAKDQQTVYTVGAWSPAGIKTIELTANGVLAQYCDLRNAQGNQQCSVVVKGANYASRGIVALQGTVTDGAGNRIAVAETNVTVKNDIVPSTPASTGSMAAWGWFETQPYVARNGVVAFRTQAFASTGLSRIDIYVNAYKRTSCSFPSNPTELQDCDTIIYGNEYIDGTYGVQVKAYDASGAEVKSPNYNLTFTAVDRSGNEMTAVSAVSLTPNKGKYMPDESTTYAIRAADADGITKIEVLVDWEIGTVCYTNTYDVATCALPFEGYKNAGKDHVIISRITDKRGNVVWTGLKNISFAASRDTATKTVSWISPNKSEIRQDETVTVGATAYAGNDVRRVEIFANGQSKYVCTYANGYAEKNCSTVLKGSDYAGNSTITVQAKTTDGSGTVRWSDTRALRIVVDTAGLWYGNQPTLNLWSSRGANGLTVLTANGQSPAGIQRIDILVNGSSVASCGNKTSCAWTGSIDSGATFSATMVDMNGRLTWSGYAQLAKNN